MSDSGLTAGQIEMREELRERNTMQQSDYEKWFKIANLASINTHEEEQFDGYKRAFVLMRDLGIHFDTAYCINECERMLVIFELSPSRDDYTVGCITGYKRALKIMRGEGL